ncbi:MAG: hypothetical protein PHC46_01235 [Clostridia bacterium]|nr:hypothetical protein [Clostridia bacterium]
MIYNQKKRITNNINTNNISYYYTLLKAISIGFLISAIVLVVFNVTGAWFLKTTTTQSTTNVGNINIVATDINNPITYTTTTTNLPITVTNLSNTHIVVRAYLNLYWVNGFPLGDVEAILANTDWTISDEGYFYYNYVLAPSGSTPDYAKFLSALEIFDETGEKLGTNFVVNIYFEGAQYANSGYANLWTNAPESWLNIIG